MRSDWLALVRACAYTYFAINLTKPDAVSLETLWSLPVYNIFLR